MVQLELTLTLLAALGSGLMAGTFFAFSAFVMSALGRLTAEQGIAAMKAINIVVLNALFLGVFFGTALDCLILALISLTWPPPEQAAWRLTGCLLYLIGCFGVTMAFNVPLNRALARVTPGSDEAASVWAAYQVRWTAWNHVRTVAPLAALACFMMVLRAAS
jgi:uncharacterized membrane protein